MNPCFQIGKNDKKYIPKTDNFAFSFVLCLLDKMQSKKTIGIVLFYIVIGFLCNFDPLVEAGCTGEKESCKSAVEDMIGVASDLIMEFEPVNCEGKDTNPCKYCNITGIHTLYVAGEVCCKEDDLKHIDFHLGVKNLIANCSGCAMLLAKHDVFATVEGLEVKSSMSFDIFSPEDAEVKNVKVVKDGKWHLHMGADKNIFSQLEALILNLLRGLIILFIKGGIKEGMPKIIEAAKDKVTNLFMVC